MSFENKAPLLSSIATEDAIKSLIPEQGVTPKKAKSNLSNMFESRPTWALGMSREQYAKEFLEHLSWIGQECTPTKFADCKTVVDVSDRFQIEKEQVELALAELSALRSSNA